MRNRNFQFGLLLSLLLHAGLLAVICTFGYSIAGQQAIVFNVEITADPPAAPGPGGGSNTIDHSLPAQVIAPQTNVSAASPAVFKPQMFSVRPILKKARVDPDAPVVARAGISSAAVTSERETGTRGDGNGPLEGYGSPNGIPGGSGTSGSVQIRLLDAPKPPFPWAARRDGFEGRAIFNVLVAADGNLQDVTMHQGSGRLDCDEAALSTIREKWRFAAAVLNGRPVSAWGRVSVRYQLQ